MNNNLTGIDSMGAEQDADRVLEIALSNLQGEGYAYLKQGVPNHGDNCLKNEGVYSNALPIAKKFLGEAIVYSRFQEQGETRP